MKKFCLFLAACLMMGCLAGCGEAEPAETTAAPTTEATQPSTEAATEQTTEAATEATTQATEPPIPNVVGYELQVPEGFVVNAADDDRTIYVSSQPEDESTILIRVQPADESVLQMGREEFQEYQGIEQEYDRVSLATTQVDGMDALYADYVVIREEQRIHIVEYIVVADENYLFQFCDFTEEEDWLDSFEDAAATIELLMENEGVELDYSHLERYTLECGLSLYAVPGMEKQNAPGFTACLGSRDAIILVMQDNKEANALTGLSLRDYADLVSRANELEAFTQDNYGNLHVNFYNSDSNGVRYFNSLTVKETQDSFWVIQMTCTSDNQAEYNREFALWATSISAN